MLRCGNVIKPQGGLQFFVEHTQMQRPRVLCDASTQALGSRSPPTRPPCSQPSPKGDAFSSLPACFVTYKMLLAPTDECEEG